MIIGFILGVICTIACLVIYAMCSVASDADEEHVKMVQNAKDNSKQIQIIEKDDK